MPPTTQCCAANSLQSVNMSLHFPLARIIAHSGLRVIRKHITNTDVGPKSRSYSAHRPFLEFESDHRVCPSQLVFYPLHRYQ